ncbi:hypothetical protein NDU88_000011 [Pleurodeles waltl]|uniref:Uncharacterized protein n=1 Tax=Pleurodeles waltl TaxID=8319 RepID=A0AAV7R7G4_PLEWA|nr:hypothetical protein NDU88_000011 [Pleurodeles waltl]
MVAESGLVGSGGGFLARVLGVTGDVGGCVDQLSESEVGEVGGQRCGVGVVVVLQVEIEVSQEDVVRRGEGVGACEVGNGVAEGGSWSWRSVYEGSSEGSVGVRVDLEMEVFGCLEGVFRVGVDLEGGFVDDGYPSTDSVGVISSGDLVAVRDGDGDVWGRGVVPPGFGQEGYVWGGGVEQVPELDGVLSCGTCVEEDAVQVVGVDCCRLCCSVAGEVAGATGEGSFGVLRGGLEAGCGGARVKVEEFAGRIAKAGCAGGVRTGGVALGTVQARTGTDGLASGTPPARQRCARCTDAQRQPLRREGGGRSSWEVGGGRERRMGARGGGAAGKQRQ